MRKPNTGSLGKNKKKVKPTHPEYTGSVTIMCPDCGKSFDMWLDAWINTNDQSKEKYFGLKLNPKDKPAGFQPPAEGPAVVPAESPAADDDVPF